MSRSINIFVYVGAGEEGEKREKTIIAEAVKRGFVNKRGEPNLSRFILHSIRYTIKHEKVTKAASRDEAWP